MQDIMVDLETLGTTPGCIILSIGAVEFDRFTGSLGREFYSVISKGSCIDHNLFADTKTLAWWEQQEDAAKTVLTAAENDSASSLVHVLAEFKSFCTHGTFDANIWGNGANFDNAILEFAYHAVGFLPGWRYNKNRCFRTLVDLAGPDVAWGERIGVYHNALDDAKTQAVHAAKCFAQLRGW